MCFTSLVSFVTDHKLICSKFAVTLQDAKQSLAEAKKKVV